MHPDLSPRSLSRRELLRRAGVGAGLLALGSAAPAAAAGGAVASSATTSTAAAGGSGASLQLTRVCVTGAQRVLLGQPGETATGDYRHLADFEADMRKLVERSPDKARLLTLPFKTLEGRVVYGIEIATDVDRRDGRPVFSGAHVDQTYRGDVPFSEAESGNVSFLLRTHHATARGQVVDLGNLVVG
ncbi:MAG: hypothetical protein M3O86_05665 [Actinomycetota bacterium]|nr:hypothetical protein [Actinomycetota bacterium]